MNIFRGAGATPAVIGLPLLCLALQTGVSAAPPPPERPNYFALYPPPATKREEPSLAFPATSTRHPDLFSPTPYFKRKFTLLTDLSLDFRATNGHFPLPGEALQGARFTVDGIIANPKSGNEQGGIRVQVVRESMPSTDRVTTSELYGYYRFELPGASATARAGQFVLPFGLAAVYDTSMHPFTSLYAESVGIRLDRGAMIEGEFGPFHYAGSITTGTGPNADHAYTKTVLAARLDRHFLTQSGRIQIGGSMLTGRLPDNGPFAQNYLSGSTEVGPTVVKSRFAADAQYFVGKYAARGEVVFGADEDAPVWGFYVDGRMGISAREGLYAAVKRWDYRNQPLSKFESALGYERTAGRHLTFRALFILSRVDPLDGPNRTLITRSAVLQSFWKF